MHCRYLPLLLTALLATTACKTAQPPTPEAPPTTAQTADEDEMTERDDDFLWLEAVQDEEALDWVRAQNEIALKELQSHPLFDKFEEQALQILNSQDRIPWPALRGGKIYNFWRDADHERGLWRIASRESYRTGHPEWETLLDLDALASEEDENWVWAGSSCRYPDYDRCIIELSIGGADATVHREFDLQTRQFIDGGFYLDESKSRLAWRHKDQVFYGPAFTDDDLTDSGYPRKVYLWDRNTAPDQAELIFEGERADVSISGTRIWDGETPYDLIVRAITFYRFEYFLYDDGEPIKIDIPADARLRGVLNEQFLIHLKTDWEFDGKTFPQGALIAASVDSIRAGSPDFQVVFVPNEHQALSGVATTKNTLILNILDDVRGKLLRFTFHDGAWTESALAVPEMGSVAVITTDDQSDDFFYEFTGFLDPTTLYEANAQADSHTLIRAEPAWFDSQGMEVHQYFATSKDGTKIPYFVVTPKGFEADGESPTLLGGYGGFEVPRTPYYSGVMGKNWLEEGGVYVSANIRGGGEYGPRWHQEALLENRQRAFDDFIAVAEDLIQKKITSPEHLGIMGGSNGGLLVGAAMIQRPDLFNAVVSQVPLLDMKRYHRLLAGASWMAEYGDPDNPEHWEFISRYSPYQNLQEGADYPKAFFTTSTRDDRVHPGHARRMVAKMLSQGHDVLYYENIEGGHGGAANQRQRAFITALTYAYLLDRLAN